MLVRDLLRAPAEAPACENVAAWWPQYRESTGACRRPFDRAIAGGTAADRVGWAFAAGYQAALHALFQDAPKDRICALCVTEAEGNSPRAIRSTFGKDGDAWVLNGAKRWTTLGPEGAVFFVAARDEAASGERPAIRIARIASDAPGLKIENMPATKFVPEVPHAQLRFDGVRVSALLPGDGYDRYVKPFRTVEDIYVNAGILAYLVREARRLGWPEPWMERTVLLLVGLEALADAAPSSAETHIALAGALAIGAELTAEADGLWDKTPADPAASRWQRDRALFGVAAQARAARSARAWQQIAEA